MQRKLISAFAACSFIFAGAALGQEFQLPDLVGEALRNNPEIQASQAHIAITTTSSTSLQWIAGGFNAA